MSEEKNNPPHFWETCPYLFVYGSLGSDSSHPLARQLQLQATRLGRGKTKGRLYDLGGYPGAVFTLDEGFWIQGEVFALPPSQPLIAQLDQYEGISVPPQQGDEYRRVLINLWLENGEFCVCWAYHWSGDPKNGILIHGGRWKP